MIMRRTNYAFYISLICVISLFTSNFFANLINSFVNTAIGKSRVRYVLSESCANQIGTGLISRFDCNTVAFRDVKTVYFSKPVTGLPKPVFYRLPKGLL